MIEKEGDIKLNKEKETVGYIALWGESITLEDLGDGIVKNKTDHSEYHIIKPLPLEHTLMFIKTIEWRFNVVD